MGNLDRELLEYQPDAAAIEAGGVPGGARWVLYVILATPAYKMDTPQGIFVKDFL